MCEHNKTQDVENDTVKDDKADRPPKKDYPRLNRDVHVPLPKKLRDGLKELEESEDTPVQSVVRPYVHDIDDGSTFLFLKITGRPVIAALEMIIKNRPYLLDENPFVVELAIAIHQLYFRKYYLIKHQNVPLEIPSTEECMDILKNEDISSQIASLDKGKPEFPLEYWLLRAVRQVSKGKYKPKSTSNLVVLLKSGNDAVKAVIQLYCIIIKKYEHEKIATTWD